MGERFLQDVDAIRAAREDRPPTSLHALIKRLGVADESRELQFKHVQEWLNSGSQVNPRLALSLEAAGFQVPTHA